MISLNLCGKNTLQDLDKNGDIKPLPNCMITGNSMQDILQQHKQKEEKFIKIRILLQILSLLVTIAINFSRTSDRVETYWIIVQIIILLVATVVWGISLVKKFKYRVEILSMLI
jgi:hypothetical protein